MHAGFPVRLIGWSTLGKNYLMMSYAGLMAANPLIICGLAAVLLQLQRFKVERCVAPDDLAVIIVVE